MSALDRLIPEPRRAELDHVDIAATVAHVWRIVRGSPLFHFDDLRSSPDEPGYQVLVDEPPYEVAAGAIGKIWRSDLPFVHVSDAATFAAFAEPGWIKVAWVVRVVPRRDGDVRLELEVRIDATDPDSWWKFRRYYLVVGPRSRSTRRHLLASFAHELGTPARHEVERALAGDNLLSDATSQATHAITIAATPEQIWPWLAQMACQRGGFHGLDLRGDHAELQRMDGFEVLKNDEPRALVLGFLYDRDAKRQLPFTARRPARFWQVTWSFVLEPIGPSLTRLFVRARAAYPRRSRLIALALRPVNAVLERIQLRLLKWQAERRGHMQVTG